MCCVLGGRGEKEMFRSNVTAEHPSRRTQEKYDRFEQWLKENGAQFDLVGETLKWS